MSDDFKNLVTGLYDLLLPVTDAEVRKRAVKSALMMLGDDPGFVEQKSKSGGCSGSSTPDDDDGEGGDYNAKAARWMQRNKITPEQIGHVLHVDGETVDLIANKIPGDKQGEKVINTYVLVGIRELFRTGEAKFTDEQGRAECERMGTHGKTNHATYLKTPGKVMTGSTKAGWTLTVPGLTAGAELVRGLAE